MSECEQTHDQTNAQLWKYIEIIHFLVMNDEPTGCMHAAALAEQFLQNP